LENPATTQIETPALVATIKTHLAKAAQSAEKSEQHFRSAGQHLKELKARKPSETPWPEYVRETFDLGRSRADELIQIADGRTTVEKTRADKAASTANSKAKLKDQAAASGGGSPKPTAADVPQEDQVADRGTSPAARRRKALHAREKKKLKARTERAAARAKLDADAAAPSDDQRKAALRLAVNENVVTFVPKADEADSCNEPGVMIFRDNDPLDNIDITDHSVGAHVIYGSLSSIDLAQTTPEAFWAIFGIAGRNPGAVKWLDTAIRKLAEIKAGQPEPAPAITP
jgi:hypothetical protein